jgi:hypothetical protein
VRDVDPGPEEFRGAHGVPGGSGWASALVRRYDEATLGGSTEISHRDVGCRELWSFDAYSVRAR